MAEGNAASGVLGVLVTGNEEKLAEFHLATYAILNSIDRRGQTVRYTCMDHDLIGALGAAKQADVTLQQIITTGTKNPRQVKLSGGVSAQISDCIEEYPVLHLSSGGDKWEPETA